MRWGWRRRCGCSASGGERRADSRDAEVERGARLDVEHAQGPVLLAGEEIAATRRPRDLDRATVGERAHGRRVRRTVGLEDPDLPREAAAVGDVRDQVTARAPLRLL